MYVYALSRLNLKKLEYFFSGPEISFLNENLCIFNASILIKKTIVVNIFNVKTITYF